MAEHRFTWDWREQPPMDGIAAAVAKLSGGRIVMELPETGSDEYELVVKSAARPGDQVKPVPNAGESMHDVVVRDLSPAADISRNPAIAEIIADVRARKQLGVDRYDSLLQAHNGRDALRDVCDELIDGACYCAQWLAENPPGSDENQRRVMGSLYWTLLGQLVVIRELITGRQGKC